ncbi:response regulator [uncultured Thiothrix sp.]|jgi:DNA-binding response OmpR family regulator|uniref:response regulator n=1 Tax=uncultured Thiothrix sp. TaxID=223185 RepID=UPI0034589FE2
MRGNIEKNSNYDLIVVGINLQGLDGFGLLHQLQKHFVNIPIIMIAASNEPKLMIQTLEQGASAYVHKGLLHNVHQVLSGNIYFHDLVQSVQIDSTFTLA